ncbi:oligosaccharide flippase family protein [Stenotrophomonas sp. GD03819]|uniref:lipopolysaccharide biosynthesis protein n=1 Tax=Stenotrophomonas sp. GD03819 TaxID=2975384 RepID=UPI002447C8D4|nr:oligosaccharide flippase family protein [Stenotrophomonas sp. GD03819]MDH1792779.1 oligosaccharide flippase family protein [Stenotrophomonas sp. GD03819]
MFRASLISAVTAILVMAVNFLVSVVTARSLGPEGRGAFYSVQVFALFVASAAQLGLGQAMVYAVRAKIIQFGAAYDRSSALTTILSVCLAAATFQVFLSDGDVSKWTALCYAAAVSITIFCGFCAQLDSSLKAYNFARIGLPVLVLLGLCAASLAETLSLRVAIDIQAAATLVIACGTWLYLRRKFRSKSSDPSLHQGPSNANRQSLMGLGLKFHVTTMTGIIATNADKIYLMARASTADLGIYSIAFSTSRILSSLYESIATSLYSRYGGQRETGSTDVVLQVFRITFVPMLIAAIAAGLAGHIFIPIIFGQRFVGATLPFSILLIEATLSGSSWMLAQKFNIDGKPGLVAVRQVASVIPMLAALPLLPQKNLIIWLSLVMTLSGAIRLFLTALFMIKMEKILLRQLVPTISDAHFVLGMFGRKGSSE